MRNDKVKDILEGKFDGYEVYKLRERSKKFESKEKEICSVEIKEEEGIALRALKDDRLVFGYTYDLVNPVGKLLRNASEILPVMEKEEGRLFPGASHVYPSLSLYDEKSLRLDDEVKAELVIALENTIRNYDSRITTVRNCELQEIMFEADIYNSNGLEAEGKKTIYMLSALCVAKDGDEVSWYDWAWATRLEDIDGEKLGTGIAERTISFLSAGQIDTREYDGILTPQTACEILGILSESFLAENLFKGKTKLKAREGTRCFSDTVTIIDSGKAGVDAFPFDGEGIPSKENLIVNNGYFETFLYDTHYGSKFGVGSTGNSVRSGIRDLPKCGTRGLFINKGKSDLFPSFTNGLIIEELMGTHTANPITGDFSLGAIGYIVRNGQKTPFQGVMISGNVFDLMQNIKQVGNDLRFYGAVGSPSLFVEGLKVSGR